MPERGPEKWFYVKGNNKMVEQDLKPGTNARGPGVTSISLKLSNYTSKMLRFVAKKGKKRNQNEVVQKRGNMSQKIREKILKAK